MNIVSSPRSSDTFAPQFAPLSSLGAMPQPEKTREPVPISRIKETAFALTSAFEGGRSDSLQIADDGIISFGPHQATLRSGALGEVMEHYFSSSKSPMSLRLRAYTPQIEARSAALAADPKFLSLLQAAASEPEMKRAQEEVFAANYWMPAYDKAGEAGLTTPLALALFYDTAVQGGLSVITARTEAQLSGSPLGAGEVSEASYLRAFLDNRRNYLLEIAENKRLQGKGVQAAMLENAAENRVGVFEEQLNNGNLYFDTPFQALGVNIAAINES